MEECDAADFPVESLKWLSRVGGGRASVLEGTDGRGPLPVGRNQVGHHDIDPWHNVTVDPVHTESIP